MRIAVAHPDRLIREALRRCLGNAGMVPIWSALNQSQLERLRRRDPPDLLLADASLLGPAGAGVRASGSDCCACLVLANNESSHGVYEALSAGALGHVAAPLLAEDGVLTGSARLLERIRRLQSLIGTSSVQTATIDHCVAGVPPIVALGASTGGPQALAQVLAGLPADLAASVLIVQHIDADYSAGLVEWLSTHSPLPVQLAQRGESILPGRVYVGGCQGHLALLRSQQLSYLAAAAADLHVPSVDMLFESLADHAAPGVAALLSGMGSDGARGLLRLRQAGWHTIAQDESSSAVYGMPRAAVEAGAAVQSLPLAAIGESLARHLAGARRLRSG